MFLNNLNSVRVYYYYMLIVLLYINSSLTDCFSSQYLTIINNCMVWENIRVCTAKNVGGYLYILLRFYPFKNVKNMSSSIANKIKINLCLVSN